jgi:hypothetical protein
LPTKKPRQKRRGVRTFDVQAIAVAARSSPELKVFFTVVLVGLLAAAIYMLRNRKKFFSHSGDPGDTYASANLRMWMVILILIHAIVVTTIMIFEV